MKFLCYPCLQYILASKATGSRTIVHSRNLEELSVGDFKLATEKLFRGNADTNNGTEDATPLWFHFEGRNMEPVLQMMQIIRERSRNSRISVEIEALRYDWTLAKRFVWALTSSFVVSSDRRESV